MSNTIEKEIDLKAPVARVWQALTDYRQFGEWFRVNLESPFVAGKITRGRLTFSECETLTMEVMVTAIEPQTRFAFTWHPYAIDTAVDYSKEMPTLVEFHLQPRGDGTHLRVTESGFDKVSAHRRAEAFRMNSNGWAIQLQRIGDYLNVHA